MKWVERAVMAERKGEVQACVGDAVASVAAEW